MINVIRDIHSLSDFRRRTAEYIRKIKETKNPLVLTVNGRAEVVVQDAESYQRMIEQLAQAEKAKASGSQSLSDAQQ